MPWINKFGKSKLLIKKRSHDNALPDSEAATSTVPELPEHIHATETEAMDISMAEAEATDLPVAELEGAIDLPIKLNYM